MKNFLTIAYYELKRILRNPRLMLIVISQPIVIALIVGLVSYQDPKDIKIGLRNQNKNQFSQQLENKLKASDKLKISDYQKVDENEIKLGKVRAFVVIDVKETDHVFGTISVLHDPTSGQVKFYIDGEVAQAMQNILKEIGGEQINAINLESKDVTPFNLKHFDNFASAMMVLLVILVVLNLSGISITTERVSGTFERLSVTPYSKMDIIFGKAIGQFLIGILVIILGISSLHLIFSISIGNIFLVALVNTLVTAIAVTLGLLISSITYTVVESIEVAMYAFFISVIATGILAPIETAYKYFPYVMKAMPFYYAVDASRRINMSGAGFAQIASNVYIMLGFFLGFLILSIIFLRREAK